MSSPKSAKRRSLLDAREKEEKGREKEGGGNHGTGFVNQKLNPQDAPWHFNDGGGQGIPPANDYMAAGGMSMADVT